MWTKFSCISIIYSRGSLTSRLYIVTLVYRLPIVGDSCSVSTMSWHRGPGLGIGLVAVSVFFTISYLIIGLHIAITQIYITKITDNDT